MWVSDRTHKSCHGARNINIWLMIYIFDDDSHFVGLWVCVFICVCVSWVWFCVGIYDGWCAQLVACAAVCSSKYTVQHFFCRLPVVGICAHNSKVCWKLGTYIHSFITYLNSDGLLHRSIGLVFPHLIDSTVKVCECDLLMSVWIVCVLCVFLWIYSFVRVGECRTLEHTSMDLCCVLCNHFERYAINISN